MSLIVYLRYNQLGRISCIVCGIQIKSEHAWSAHVISKTHKQNASRELQTSVKRLAESTTIPLVQIKKSKPDSANSKPSGPASHASQTPEVSEVTGATKTDEVSLGEKNPAEKTRADTSGSRLPEGFFDDRYRDAKVRNVPYKDKFTEEMEVFQKEMSSLEKQSEIIMEKESEAMVSSRELEEIDTQMQKWNRIKQLQTEVESFENKRREKTATIVRAPKSNSDASDFLTDTVKEEPSTDSDDASVVDELYDFRTKKVA
ncbi:hypothetical protein FGIG_05202 [Fasciola gigantica]|uniref:Zinc finger protein 830 n=1 Tax=Fasciola gigantica TaxID=46835 RepID=A0A504YQJ8_FASGI|nr:hypothetical protein FGIG_05202 [Fasciola gigantica]